jgi:hypothetical protein
MTINQREKNGGEYKHQNAKLKIQTCIHRAQSSGVVSSRNPQMSAPTIGIANKENERMCGIEIWEHGKNV